MLGTVLITLHILIHSASHPPSEASTVIISVLQLARERLCWDWALWLSPSTVPNLIRWTLISSHLATGHLLQLHSVASDNFQFHLLFCARNCSHRHFLKSLLLKCKACNWPLWWKGGHVHLVECHLYANYHTAAWSFCCVVLGAAWRPSWLYGRPSPAPVTWHWLGLCWVAQFNMAHFSSLSSSVSSAVRWTTTYEARDLPSRRLPSSCWDRTSPGWITEIVTAALNKVLHWAAGLPRCCIGSEKGHSRMDFAKEGG